MGSPLLGIAPHGWELSQQQIDPECDQVLVRLGLKVVPKRHGPGLQALAVGHGRPPGRGMAHRVRWRPVPPKPAGYPG
jgi:hypothetical protein